jgi:hypothetical protein
VAARVSSRHWERDRGIGGGRKRLLSNLPPSLSPCNHGEGEDAPAPYPTTHGEPPGPSSPQA